MPLSDISLQSLPQLLKGKALATNRNISKATGTEPIAVIIPMVPFFVLIIAAECTVPMESFSLQSTGPIYDCCDKNWNEAR